MKSRGSNNRGMGLAVVVAAVGLLATACVMVPAPIPQGYATVQYENVAPPPEPPAVIVAQPSPPPMVVVAPPPPLIILPPAPVVIYNSHIHCDYVMGLNYDVFYVGGFFWTHHHDHWYCAPRPGAGWVVAEPRYVPRELAPGPPAAGWRSQAYELGKPRKVERFKDKVPFPAASAQAVAPAAGAVQGASKGKIQASQVQSRNAVKTAQQGAVTNSQALLPRPPQEPKLKQAGQGKLKSVTVAPGKTLPVGSAPGAVVSNPQTGSQGVIKARGKGPSATSTKSVDVKKKSTGRKGETAKKNEQNEGDAEK